MPASAFRSVTQLLADDVKKKDKKRNKQTKNQHEVAMVPSMGWGSAGLEGGGQGERKTGQR